MDKLFISEKHLLMIQNIFLEYIPKSKVLAYGSRLNGSSCSVHSGSDLDLAIVDLAGSDVNLYELREIIDNSNIPFLIDIFEFDKLPTNFQNEIEKNNVEIFPKFRGQYQQL